MFFIWAFVTAGVLALLLSVLLARIKTVAYSDRNEITVVLIFFGFIRIVRKYALEYDDKNILELYHIGRAKRRLVITLRQAAKKMLKNIPAEITLVDMFTLLTQFKKRPRNYFFAHLFKKAKFEINMDLMLGTQDAFHTAILCGLLRALSGALYSAAHGANRKVVAKISPEFSKQVISVKINCIIAIAPADIIIGYLVNLIKKRR